MRFGVLRSLNVEGIEEVRTILTRLIQDVAGILNRGIRIGDQYPGNVQSVTFTGAGVEVQVLHGLGRVPDGYLVLSRSASVIIYDGASANTDSIGFLRASGAGTATVLFL